MELYAVFIKETDYIVSLHQTKEGAEKNLKSLDPEDEGLYLIDKPVIHK